MASTSQPKILSYKAGADLSAHQFKIVKFGADEKTIALCGAGERGIGVLQNAPKSGEVAEVAIFGAGAKVKAVGVITAGNSFASDATGFAKAATTGQFCLGVSFKTTVANEVFAAELAPHFLP